MARFTASFKEGEKLNAHFGEVQQVSTSDYEKLINRPYINNEEVIGNKTGADYHLQDKMEVLSIQEIEKILYL